MSPAPEVLSADRWKRSHIKTPLLVSMPWISSSTRLRSDPLRARVFSRRQLPWVETSIPLRRGVQCSSSLLLELPPLLGCLLGALLLLVLSRILPWTRAPDIPPVFQIQLLQLLQTKRGDMGQSIHKWTTIQHSAFHYSTKQLTGKRWILCFTFESTQDT